MYTLSGPFVLALPALHYLLGWRKKPLQKAIRKTKAHLQKSRGVGIMLMSDWEGVGVSVSLARLEDDEFLVCTCKENSGTGADSLRKQLERIAIDLQISVVYSRSDADHPETCHVAVVIKARVDDVSRMVEAIFDEVAGYTLRDRVIMRMDNLDNNSVPIAPSPTP